MGRAVDEDRLPATPTGSMVATGIEGGSEPTGIRVIGGIRDAASFAPPPWRRPLSVVDRRFVAESGWRAGSLSKSLESLTGRDDPRGKSPNDQGKRHSR
jgi:hypothetical protein